MCVTNENDTGGLSVLLLATAVAKRVCNRLLLMLQVMQSEGNAISFVLSFRTLPPPPPVSGS